MIPYGRQDITQVDIDSVVEVLKSDFLTQGPVVPKFELNVAAYCGAAEAVAVNSATSALHIACLALDLGPGDWLWTSPITFVASANCALYCGARVDFIDIDPQTYNLSVERLEEKLAQAEKDGKLPKILVAVHLCGQSCDMTNIHRLSRRYGFKIIEDASHAIGGRYRGNQTQNGDFEKIGNCRYSDITVFSFHPVKIITTAEGGMALTNDLALADRMRLYRSHGITKVTDRMYLRHDNEIWNYQQTELGYNYRMTDIQAALGMSQMTRIDEFVAKRRAIARRYDEALVDLPLQTPWQNPDCDSSYHLYPIRLDLGRCQKTQREIYGRLLAAGIGVNLHYIPVYRQPYYEALGFKLGYCPEAEKYFCDALTIPLYPTLTEDDQNRILGMIHEVLI